MCITVDHDTIKTQTVTVRCRDTMQQVCVCVHLSLDTSVFAQRRMLPVTSARSSLHGYRFLIMNNSKELTSLILYPTFFLLAPYLPRSAWVSTNW